MRRFLLASMFLVPGLAFAQNMPYPPPPQATQGMSQHGGPEHFIEKFQAANTTHNGKLTLAQAQAGGMRMIARHFSEIDVANQGYITLPEIKAWRNAHPRGRHPQGQGMPPVNNEMGSPG
jgi:hypothetical protein